MPGLNAGYPARSGSAAARGFRRAASRSSSAANDNQAPSSSSRNNLMQFPTEDVLRNYARQIAREMMQEALDPAAYLTGRFGQAIQTSRWLLEWYNTGRFAAIGPYAPAGWTLLKNCWPPGDPRFYAIAGTVCAVANAWYDSLAYKYYDTGLAYYCRFPRYRPRYSGDVWEVAQIWTYPYTNPKPVDVGAPRYYTPRCPVEVPAVPISPMINPMVLPIRVPTTRPEPWPYTLVPYRRTLPDLVEQTERGNRPAEWPEVVEVPREVALGRAAMVDRVTISAIAPGASPGVKLELAEHRFEPPRDGKEKKTRTPYGGVFNALRKLVGGATEVMDFINAIWWALPKEYRTPGADPYEQLKDIVNNYNHLDTNKALWNIGANEIQDRAIGKSNKGWQKVAAGMGWLGPSPNVGSGYRQSAIQPATDAVKG